MLKNKGGKAGALDYQREQAEREAQERLQNRPVGQPSPITGPTNAQMGRPTTASQERTDRIEDTAQQVQAAAQGQVPQAAVIPSC